MIKPKLKPKWLKRLYRNAKQWYCDKLFPKSILVWLCAISATALILTFSHAWRAEWAFVVFGAVLAGIFEVSSAYHARVSHFLECFSRCNESYAMVKRNGLLRLPSPQVQGCIGPGANDGSSDVIIDYFNLCAQEYLMYKMGVIPVKVWDVWRAGIHDCARQDHLKAAWDQEMKANCHYYGFDLEQIILEHHQAHGRECEKRDSCPCAQVIARTSRAAA